MERNRTQMPNAAIGGVVAVLALWMWSCDPSKKEKTTQTEAPAAYAYDYTKPTAKYEMPAVLKEISGISFYQENQLLCVQDEAGEAFVYDLAQQKIEKKHLFGPPDDYEDIVQVKDEIYALRSDGKLFNFKWGDKQTREIETDLPGKNDVEGLTYNPENNRLYLAVKEASKKATDKGDKLIYSFDLKRRAVYEELKLIESRFENAGLKGKDWKDFKPSGVAIQPQTGQVYLLSSAGHRLLVLSKNGSPLQNIELNPSTFRQPEGICFAPNGTLYIASEGDGKKGYILQFSPANSPL
ncbi:MAG: hypothetical protein EAZ32_15385 [Cytophagia bacterium]|nr:MAG: hypothetical protein EAZ46_09850 [Runella sp.]TAG17943.1 MAG: hypothetical protein EAZ38_16265 [Cytophagales bacterium]TAG37445.1 MAG: hypothetical protein EAZ32_15385 [Cytophagia bacterium]TAG48363.1 MAG: hypothetical protein EAZ29_13510 [Runella slithyformis]TAG78521.1 MAG: hypothetical protein EAZ22_13475 [Cytophagales bacterium]